jgi:hypothetical protein
VAFQLSTYVRVYLPTVAEGKHGVLYLEAEQLGLDGYGFDAFSSNYYVFVAELVWKLMPIKPSLAPLRASI